MFHFTPDFYPSIIVHCVAKKTLPGRLERTLQEKCTSPGGFIRLLDCSVCSITPILSANYGAVKEISENYDFFFRELSCYWWRTRVKLIYRVISHCWPPCLHGMLSEKKFNCSLEPGLVLVHLARLAFYYEFFMIAWGSSRERQHRIRQAGSCGPLVFSRRSRVQPRSIISGQVYPFNRPLLRPRHPSCFHISWLMLPFHRH